MKTLTVKVPESLDKKLRQVAKRRGQPVSEVARAALRRETDGGGMDFETAAAKYRGMLKGGPADLSTREGYGR
jgi:predicted transcriptional regulator